MRPPAFSKFVHKAEAALTSAVEVYNKPSFAYREETFAILMLNAWELLLKARLIQTANNPRIIYLYEIRQTKSGTKSKKLYLKRNRSGNPMTIGVGKCISELDKQTSSALGLIVKANLDALIEVRDNSSHFVQATPILAKQILEIGSASIQNFVVLAKRWFNCDFSESLCLILPLSFINPNSNASIVSVSPDEKRLIQHLQNLVSCDEENDSELYVSVRLDIKLEKSKLNDVTKVMISNDSTALKLALTEENIRQSYPWDYKELVKRLVERYSDFKVNPQFHDLRKSLLNDLRYAKSRLLDPDNPKSGKKDFYNANILQIFDEHYRRK
jgi:hypothetical protein